MIPKSAKFFLLALVLCVESVGAQREQDSLRVDNSFKFFDLRGTNVADLGLGGSTLLEITKTRILDFTIG